jgi:hypothetical protein
MLRTASFITLLFVVVCISPSSLLAESVSVSAVVPTNATNFSTGLTSTQTATVGQDTILTYTLDYNSALTTDTQVTLEASWSRGTIIGSGAEADVLSYVPGSATSASGNTSPVIDTINRKITWDIPALPGNTPQQVTFQLRTSNTLTSSQEINYTVSSDIKGPGFTTTPNTVTGSFQEEPQATPTSTPTPAPPTSTPTTPPSSISPTPTAPIPTSSTPRPTASLKLAEVTVRTITSADATIAVSLTQPSSIRLNYGENINSITEEISDLPSRTEHLISLTNLKPATTYFFRVYYGGKLSEIYTLVTALPGEVPAPLLQSLVVTSGNTVLTTPLQAAVTSSPVSELMLPTKTFYEFRISIPNSVNLTHVQAILRHSKILALSSTEDTVTALDLIEISPGIFTGRLFTPPVAGIYNLFLRLSDKKGNIVEQKLTDIHISTPFIVLNEDHKPIEGARVKLWYYDLQKKTFKYLDPQSISIPNPSFSQVDGIVPIVLPQGRYRAEISDLRYTTRTIEFSVGNSEKDSYPEVILKGQPFNILAVLRYFGSTIRDLVYTQTHDYVLTLAQSRRVLDLVSFVTLLSFVILLIASFLTKAQLSLMMLPHYLVYLYERLLRIKSASHSLEGEITTSYDGRPIQGVAIYAIDHMTGKIVSHAISNSQGNFILFDLNQDIYTLSCVKNGYRPFTLQSVAPEFTTHSLRIAMNNTQYHRTVPHFLLALLLFVLEKGFVGIMIASFIFCLVIEVSLGWHEVIPYLIIASFNMLTWFLHERYQ